MAASNRGSGHSKPPFLGRILLVDDHEALASIVAGFLSQEGYEVKWARNCRQARLLLATEIVHLVITDSELPDGSGWELAWGARHRRLPVILSSGWPVRIAPGELTARGVDYLCPKPCRLEQLLCFAKKALRQRKWRDARATPVPKSQYQSHR